MLRLCVCLLSLCFVLSGCEDDRRRTRRDTGGPRPVDSGGFDSGGFDSGGFDAGPVLTGCVQSDLGSRLGTVSTGSTLGRASNHVPSCGTSTDAPDIGFTWTAPSSGTFTFDTNGSDFDTIVEVRDGSCDGLSLGCDDDGGDSTTSLLSLSLSAGERVVVIVDGYSTNDGNYTLTISNGL